MTGRRSLAWLEDFGDRIPSALFLVLFCLLLLSAVAVKRGGYLHKEAEKYIPHYLSSRPVLEKIYDFQQVEIDGQFRPRPLSYLVDDWDVQFIGWSAAKGLVHFESASYLVFWVLNAFLLWYCFRSLFGLDKLTSALLVGLLSTSPVLFFNTHYFRSAKPGSVFFMLCAFVVLWWCFAGLMRGVALWRSIGLGVAAFSLLTAACLFDEIPAAYCLAAMVMLGMKAYMSRGTVESQAAGFCLLPIGAATGCFAVYNLFIHSMLLGT